MDFTNLSYTLCAALYILLLGNEIATLNEMGTLPEFQSLFYLTRSLVIAFLNVWLFLGWAMGCCLASKPYAAAKCFLLAALLVADAAFGVYFLYYYAKPPLATFFGLKFLLIAFFLVNFNITREIEKRLARRRSPREAVVPGDRLEMAGLYRPPRRQAQGNNLPEGDYEGAVFNPIHQLPQHLAGSLDSGFDCNSFY